MHSHLKQPKIMHSKPLFSSLVTLSGKICTHVAKTIPNSLEWILQAVWRIGYVYNSIFLHFHSVSQVWTATSGSADGNQCDLIGRCGDMWGVGMGVRLNLLSPQPLSKVIGAMTWATSRVA